jgi:23S rRNA (adenine2503-C2)-methyltransferase
LRASRLHYCFATGSFQTLYLCDRKTAMIRDVTTKEDTKADIRLLSLEQIAERFAVIGLPKFRSKQVWEWLWNKGVTDFELMTTLSKDLRAQLAEQFVIRPMATDKVQFSNDGTMKFRFKLHDGHLIESVLIPVQRDDRYTVCVSSQVGCSLTCSFCATGRMGRLRNLDPGEIYDQVHAVNKQCLESFNHPITNVVYMGMGEPLLTYANVMRSIELLTDPTCMGMSARRITLSTAGIAKMIKKLADDNSKVNLALSLHAATDEQRNTIMPINESNDLVSLMDALSYYYQQTGNRISYEYIAFQGFNDTPEDAIRLARLCRRFPVRVNIIEYNAIDNAPMEKSDDDRLNLFANILADEGVTVTVRRSRGKDIDAACGQLANKG